MTKLGHACVRLEHGGATVVIDPGGRTEVAGLDVHVYGERHATTHMPSVANVGFFIEGDLFHPGDALTVPEEGVGTLLLPTTGPWLKSVELMDYVSQVQPQRAYAIHDGLVNEVGLMVVDNIMAALPAESDRDYRRIQPGQRCRPSLTRARFGGSLPASARCPGRHVFIGYGSVTPECNPVARSSLDAWPAPSATPVPCRSHR